MAETESFILWAMDKWFLPQAFKGTIHTERGKAAGAAKKE